MNWEGKFLSFAGALAVLALPAFFTQRPDLPIILLGMAGVSTVAAGAAFGVRKLGGWPTVSARLFSPLRWLKRARVRSPLVLEELPSPRAHEIPDPPVTFARLRRSPEEELRSCEERLNQHLDVMKYGKTIFHPLPPFSPLEMEFYQKGARDLLPFAKEAGTAQRAFLMAVLQKMWRLPEEDARYWLAHFLNTELYNRLTATQERFENQVEQGADSRQALAAFYYQYERTMRALARVKKFPDTVFSSLEEGRKFAEPHKQFIEALRRQLELPQFAALRDWLYSPKPDEYYWV